MSRPFRRTLQALIVTIGATAGWITGHAAGPFRLELPPLATGLLGAVSGAGILIVGCLFAIARREKRNLSRNSDRHFVNMIQSPSQTASRRKAGAGPPPPGDGPPHDDAVRGGIGSALAVES